MMKMSLVYSLTYLQAAFDTITPASTKEVLLRHNLDDQLVGLYYTFLTHRHFIAEHNEVT